jgi:hypothetical protein
MQTIEETNLTQQTDKVREINWLICRAKKHATKHGSAIQQAVDQYFSMPPSQEIEYSADLPLVNLWRKLMLQDDERLIISCALAALIRWPYYHHVSHTASLMEKRMEYTPEFHRGICAGFIAGITWARAKGFTSLRENAVDICITDILFFKGTRSPAGAIALGHITNYTEKYIECSNRGYLLDRFSGCYHACIKQEKLSPFADAVTKQFVAHIYTKLSTLELLNGLQHVIKFPGLQ